MKDLFIYIITNERRTTLYIGVTNNLESRVWQHRHGEGFVRFSVGLEDVADLTADLAQALDCVA